MGLTATDIEVDAARWFFASSEDIFVIMRDGVVERVNPAWTRISGWSEAETVGRRFNDFAHPDEIDILIEVVRDLTEIGSARCEQRLRTKSGEWKWVRSRSTLRPDGVAMVAVQDITDARRQEVESVHSTRARELLREEAGLFIWRFDPATNRYEVDSDLTKEGGRGAAGRRSLSADEMTSEIHPDDISRVTENFLHTVRTGEARVVEYRHVSAETGGWAHLRAAWRGVQRMDAGYWLVMGITQDVTALAEARDAALAAAEVQARFLANMSHEIRTPMNGVLGVLHLLKREALSADGRALLDEALGCGAMLAELLNDVIDFSRIEAGRLELAPEPVDPAVVTEGVAALLRPQAQAKGVALDIVAEAGGYALIDPVRMRQILFNLMGNALKFTPKGRIEVRLTRVAGDRLRVEVEDTGIGVPLDAQANLFDRFQQADGSATRRYGGSGLGLAIARGLAELMDGEIGFSSQPGVGSTFWVELSAPTAAAPAAHIDPDEDAPLLEGAKVLVVEDNATNRLIATRLLEQLGASVSTADDGAQGVQAAGSAAFDLIFMDVQMPVMDGVEASRRIRSQGGPCASAPIIAMTANVMAHQTRAYLDAGMNGCLAKPLSPAALVKAIVDVAAGGVEQAA